MTCLAGAESIDYYAFKCLRVVHLFKVYSPFETMIEMVATLSHAARPTDLISFIGVIFYIVYLNHVMACIWLQLGYRHDCSTVSGDERCTDSWVYAGDPPNRFVDKPRRSQYIFAFYWIFEVITTVGYGDFTGDTAEEQLYSVFVQFTGLVFFSLLMTQVTNFLNSNDDFESLIEAHMERLDMWIKKIENSNEPYFIQPYLYYELKTYLDMAYKFDFNIAVEEFPFFYQLTDRL